MLGGANADHLHRRVESLPLTGSQNYAISEQGNELLARIARFTEPPKPWRKAEFEVFAER